eukprot:6209142-Pleurochrysis_carterae.AAC.4
MSIECTGAVYLALYGTVPVEYSLCQSRRSRAPPGAAAAMPAAPDPDDAADWSPLAWLCCGRATPGRTAHTAARARGSGRNQPSDMGARCTLT